MSLRRWFPQDNKVAHDVKLDATRESSSSTWEGDSLREERGVADFSEAERDAVEAREDFWRIQ